TYSAPEGYPSPKKPNPEEAVVPEISPTEFQKASPSSPSVDIGGRPFAREQMGPMMSRQKDLPPIPVAPLQETLDRYLKSLKLLLTTEQFEETQKLPERWMEEKFLRHREPLLFNFSPAVSLPKQKIETEESMLRSVDSHELTVTKKGPKNAESLEAIKEAAFVLCLDKKPSVDEESDELTGVRQVHLGGTHGENGANRWFDKTVQLIVGESGHSGILFEPTPVDGGVRLALADHCLDYMVRNDAELTILHFPSYGKDLIKSRHMSPDSFVQMAIQLAFHKMSKVPNGLHEIVSMRQFAHGRVAAVNGTSFESLSLCRAFEGRHFNRSERFASLMEATRTHKQEVLLVFEVSYR
ncbi:hypothetical protein HPB47_026887, partial [Ixodes persulcatus]